MGDGMDMISLNLGPDQSFDAFAQTTHQKAVEQFLKGIGHHIPDKPQVPDLRVLRTWLYLHLEEVWELLAAAGAYIKLDPCCSHYDPIRWQQLNLYPTDKLEDVDLVELVDALADIQVISTGLLSICGVKDARILGEVDTNNLLKLKGGHIDPHSGKFVKPLNHPKPDFAQRLKDQGWEPPASEVA